MKCRTCQAENDDSAMVCNDCGASLGQTMVKSHVAVNHVSNLGGANFLAPVLGDHEDMTLAFELPGHEFDFLIGRTDLNNGIVPMISVEKKWPQTVLKPGGSWLFSRRTARIRRDATGQLLLKVEPECSIVVLIALPGSDDFEKVVADNEVSLNIGTTLMFGYGGESVRAVIR